jgi:hypothetical protein
MKLIFCECGVLYRENSFCPECNAKEYDFQGVIDHFNQMKEDYINNFMKRDKVSLAMIYKKDKFVENCDWTIKQLEEEIKERTHVKNENI